MSMQALPIGRWIERCHRQLEELFLVHQEALLMLHLDVSRELLRCYRESLQLHMRFEEEQVFPGYAGLAEQGRWPASLYVREHAKLLELLGECEEELERLTGLAGGARGLRRGVIALLDREKMVKSVSEHHEMREEEFMLPLLEADLPSSLHASRIAGMQATWSDHQKRMASLVREACAAWP